MTDPAEPPVPRSGPLRLDGAFPRRDVDDWLAAAEASLKGHATLDDLGRESADGLPLPVLFHDSPVTGRVTPAERSAEGAADRGPAAPDVPAWDNRLHVLGETPAGRAAHALAGLAGGVTSLEIAVRATDKADGNDASALSLADLPASLEGIHLDMIALSLRAGDDAGSALDALLDLYRERDLEPDTARIELDADPLGALARRGRVAGGLDAARERLGALVARGSREFPAARLVSIDTAVHHAAGATPVQELVAGIAAATFALDTLLDAGVEPETALGTLGFRVALDADIIGGVVKLRALERLWRHTLAGAALPDLRAPVVAETSHRQLARLAPWVNHLRNIAACTAAAIGNADTVIVHPHDRVDGQRVGEDPVVADRVARNLPLLLAEEGGLLAVEDAAGGSHAIESLTQSTVEAAWSALGELQATGGLAAALASGEWQRSVAARHAERVGRLAGGERVRVGVTRFRHDGADVSAPTRAGEGVCAGTSPAKPPAGDLSAETSAPLRDGESSRSGQPADVGDENGIEPLAPVREAEPFETTAPGDAGDRGDDGDARDAAADDASSFAGESA